MGISPPIGVRPGAGRLADFAASHRSPVGNGSLGEQCLGSLRYWGRVLLNVFAKFVHLIRVKPPDPAGKLRGCVGEPRGDEILKVRWRAMFDLDEPARLHDLL